MKFITILLFVAICFISCHQDSDGGTVQNSGTDGIAGSLASFITIDDRLYIIDDNTLQVFDISTPDKLELKNTTRLGNGVETIFPYKNHLFFGTTRGMLIYDNSEKDNPKYVSKYEHVQSCDPVFVKDNYAYVTLRRDNFDLSRSRCFRGVSQLDVVDVSNYLNPTVVKTIPMANPIGLSAVDNSLFVCDSKEDLHRFDITDPTKTELKEKYDIPGHDLIIADDLMMVISRKKLSQFQVEDNQLKPLSDIKM